MERREFETLITIVEVMGSIVKVIESIFFVMSRFIISDSVVAIVNILVTIPSTRRIGQVQVLIEGVGGKVVVLLLKESGQVEHNTETGWFFFFSFF